ncbi:olfactory receptor 52D1-like [Discoglossus pictus]
METMNSNQSSSFSYTVFILYGFPGFSNSRQLLVLPFLSIYIIILTGNSIIVYKIWVERSLQSPMYFLISLLFIINISCTTAVMPKWIVGLAFGLNQIDLGGCLVQMFVIYLTVISESSVVLIMALDRYIAICNPLRYHDIMTNHLLLKLNVISLVRCVILVSPIIISVSRVQFCKSNIILNFACENMSLLNLGCGDISKTHIIGLVVRILVTTSDGSIFLVSYLKILSTAIHIATGKSRHKALHTCGTHMIVAMLIYFCGFLSSMIYRASASVSLDTQNLISAIYFLFPAAVNPVIYGLRVKEIRICLWKKKLRLDGQVKIKRLNNVHQTTMNMDSERRS